MFFFLSREGLHDNIIISCLGMILSEETTIGHSHFVKLGIARG